MLGHSLQMSVHIFPVPGNRDITTQSTSPGPNGISSSPSKHRLGRGGVDREAHSLSGLESLGMRSDTGKGKWACWLHVTTWESPER